jgi:hypothetical protein
MLENPQQRAKLAIQEVVNPQPKNLPIKVKG